MVLVTTPFSERRREGATLRAGSLRERLLASTALAVVLLAAPFVLRPAAANPLGGQVVTGTATITAPNTSTLDIVQSTPRAAIDWQSFNIGAGQTTNFQQPSASAVTLNRVQAGDPSVIAGHLNANGQVILVNPSGVTFTRGAQVNVNSIIATPSDISNSDFMNGRMNFDIPSNDPRARVVNRGRITVAEKGLAALVAPGAANSGVIQAKLGTVVIDGARTFTVDFYGDGLINFALTSPVTAVPLTADGKPATSLVSNSGRIDAAGGTVLMTADAAAGILRTVVDVSGRVSAPTYAQTPGSVTVDAGAGNAARVSGRIDVSGYRPGEVGGSAVVTGGTVDLAPSARILARGPAGGGTVMIGGGPHGADASVADAQVTNVAPGALIDASATGAGNGGNVTVWSNGTTVFDGTILARGGPQGGNGGIVETSGEGQLIVGSTASVSATAPMGTAGTWLLDPDSNVTITSPGGGTYSTTPYNPTTDSSELNVGSIISTLNAGTNVVVTTSNSGTPPGTQPGNIFVGAIPGGTDGAIDAANGLDLSKAVTLILQAGSGGGAGSVTVNSPISDTGANNALSVTLIATNSGNVAIDNSVTIAGTLFLSAGGTITQTSPVAAASLVASSGAGSVDLPLANAVATVAGSVTGSGAFDFNDTETLTVGTVQGASGISTDGGNIVLKTTTAGDIQINEPVNAGAGAIGLSSVGGIGEGTDGGLLGAALEVLSANAVTLESVNNQIGTAATPGLVSGAVANTGQSFSLASSNVSGAASLQVDTVQVTAGSLALGSKTGIATQGAAPGDITLAVDGGGNLLLNAPVDASGGMQTLGATPGVIALASQEGGVSQTAAGPVVGSALVAIANTNSTLPTMTNNAVDLTAAANQIGTSTSPGRLAGTVITQGNFAFVDNAENGLATASVVGRSGITTPGSAISLAATAGSITITNGNNLTSIGGEIDVAAAATFGITNQGAISSSGGNVVLIGDFLSLGGQTPPSTINAGAGTVLLGPATLSDSISLGKASTGGVLGLQTADLRTITALTVQIGYVTTGGTQFYGNIDVAAAGLSIDTSDIPVLALVTSGAITESAGAITSTGSSPLRLGVIAGGSVTMTQANGIGFLAGLSDGGSGSFTFSNDATLTIAALPSPQLGVTFSGGLVASGSLSVPNSSGGGLAGVLTDAAPPPPPGALNIILETTAGNLVLDEPVTAGASPNFALVGLSSAGTITQAAAGVITASGLEIDAKNSVTLTGNNSVGTLAATVLTSGQSVSFNDVGASGLSVGTVDVRDTSSNRIIDQSNAPTQLTAALSGAVTNDGNILIETTTSGSLILNEPVDAGSGAGGASVALGSAGTITQGAAGTITTGTGSGVGLEIVSAERVSLGASGGTSAPNQVGTLAAEVLNGGESFVFRNDGQTLTIGTVDVVDTAGNRLFANPTTLTAQLASGGLSGIATNGANIGLRVTTSGDLALSGSTIDAGTAGVALEANGNITQSSGTITAASLEASATDGYIGLAGNNAIGTVAGQATNAGSGFEAVNAAATLTVGTVGPVEEQGTGSTGAQMSSVGALSGVVANGGNIVLDTFFSGDLTLNEPVNANNFVGGAPTTILQATPGEIGLLSAGALSQSAAGIILGSALDIEGAGGSVTLLAANRIGANDDPQSSSGVATTAGIVAASDIGTFQLRDDRADLQVGTVGNVTVETGLPGASGIVTTNNGGILLETTTAGTLALIQAVDAGTGTVQLVAAGAISQAAAGMITAGSLEAVTEAAGGEPITLANTGNAVSGAVTLTALNANGSAVAAGAISFYDGLSLSIDVPVMPLVSATYEVGIDTGSSAILQSAGASGITETAASSVIANSLEVVTLNANGAPITLDNPTNSVAQVALSTLNAGGTAAEPGTISLIDDAGFAVAAPGTPLYAPEIGVETTGTVALVSNLAGATFTNSGTIDTTGQGALPAGNDIAILADMMSLSSGTIDAGTAGRVLLGPLTTTQPITLVGSGGAAVGGTLNLADADLATITAGLLEISVPGLSDTGTISVSGAVSLPAAVPTLLLSTAGQITDNSTAGNTIAVANLALAAQSVHLTGANTVDTVAGAATAGFAFGDSVSTLDVGTVPPSVAIATLGFSGSVPVFNNDPAPQAVGITTVGSITVQNAGNLTIAAPVGTLLAGPGSNITLETTGASGNLTLNAAVDAGTATIGLSSVGTITQDAAGSITGSDLAILSNERVSLGASGGANAPNSVSTLAAQVFNSGESFVYTNDQTLTVGNVNGVSDVFGATLLNPSTGTADGFVSGVTIDNANIGLRAIGAGPPAAALRLDANVDAGSGSLGLEATGQITNNGGGFLTAAALEAYAGSVSIADGSVSGAVSGRATAAGGTFAFADFGSLTIGTVGPIDEQGTGATGTQMLSVGAISGVATQNGTIALQAIGNLALGQTVDANGFNPTTLAPTVPLDAATAGSVFLGSEFGTIGQDPTNGAIVAAGLDIESDLRVSLGAFGNAASGAANQVATLAAIVLSPGESFVFRDDSTDLTIGTLSLGGGPPVVGVTTNDANIGLRVTTSGTLTLAASVNAADGALSPSGAGSVGLESSGTIDQTGGTITASALEIDAVGTGAGHDVSLPQGNFVATLAAQGAGTLTFADATTLTIGTVGPILETGTGISGSGPQMLAAGAIDGLAQGGGVMLTTTGSGSDLVLSSSLTASGQTVTLVSAGTIDQTAGIITAADVTGSSSGGANLTDGNMVADFGAFTNATGGLLSFTDAESLATTGTLSSAGGITLTTIGPGSNLSLGGAVTSPGQTVTLISAGTIDQTAGIITAGDVTGSSTGATSLTDGNMATDLGPFASGGALSFADAESLATTGTVSATGGLTLTTTGPGSNLSLGGALTASGQTVTLVSAGPIGQTAGIITAANVTGSSVGGASLTAGNMVPDFGTFANAGGGLLSFTDAESLTTTGTLSSAGGIALTTTGSGSNLSLGGPVTAGAAVTLTSAGTIGQTAGGIITAGDVTGSSVGATMLTDGNEATDLGPFASGGALSFADAESLATTGTVSATGGLTLTTTGPGSNLSLGGALTASGQTVTLVSAGTIGQNAGIITAADVTGSSAGGASLGDANMVANFGAFTNATGGLLSFTDAESLTTTGTLSSAGGIALTTKGAGSDLSLGGPVTASGTVTLTSAGTVGQAAGGIVTATSLAVDSTGGTALGDSNAVAGLAASINTGGGGFLFVDGQALTVDGAVAAGSGALALGSSGPLTIDGALSAGGTISLQGAGIALAADVAGGGAVTLDGTTGPIGQTGGAIAGTSLAVSATGGVALGDGNAVPVLAASSNAGSGGFLLVDGQALTVTGAVGAGSGGLTLTAAGVLTVDAGLGAGGNLSLQGTAVDLAATAAAGGTASVIATSGDAVETGGGIVSAAALLVDAGGAVDFDGANPVGTLAGSAGGPFQFAAAGGLSVGTVGAQSGVTTASGDIGIATLSGDLSLAAGVAAGGGADGVALVAAGNAVEAGGTVTAGGLIVDAGGAVVFGGANRVATLAGTAAGLFELVDAQALTIGTVGPLAGAAGPVAGAGVATGSGAIALATTAGDLVLAANVEAAGGGNEAVLSAGGNLSEAGGGVTASGLIANAGGAVGLDGANAVPVLAGFSGGAFRFTAEGGLTIGGVAAPAGAAAGFGPQSGVATIAGDVRILAAGGNLVLASGVSAGSGGDDAALIAGGNASEAGGAVTAAALVVQAGGNVAFNTAPNAVASLSGSALSGTFDFLGRGPLAIAPVPAIADRPAQSGLSAAGSVLVTSQSTLSVTGDIAIGADGDVVLDANGAFLQQGGVLDVATTSGGRPVLAIDTTGLGADAVAATIAGEPASAELIRLFPPSAADNPMRFADLEAPGYVTLLIGGSGAVGGRIDVLQLGVSGSGGSASLSGSVGGMSGPSAALLGVRDPSPDIFYDLNGCAIGSADCFTLTSIVPIQPQPVSEFDLLTILPGIDDTGFPVVEFLDDDRS